MSDVKLKHCMLYAVCCMDVSVVLLGSGPGHGLTHYKTQENDKNKSKETVQTSDITCIDNQKKSYADIDIPCFDVGS